MTSAYKLSEGSLQIIMEGGNVYEPLMQVLGSKKMNSTVVDKERFRLVVSDGKFSINIAMYSLQLNDQSAAAALQIHSIIKLKRYVSNVVKSKEKDKRDMRILLILDLELVAAGDVVGHVIGNPSPLVDHEVQNSQWSEISSPTSVTSSVKKLGAERKNRLSESKVISPISSLCPFHNNWVIRARVINKTNIRNWSNARGEGKLFSVDLVDESGEIRCTAFRELVDKFFDYLEVDKVYYVSKCQLQPINRQFCSLNHNFELTMTSETEIQESFTNNEILPQITYNFTSIDKVALMETGTIVDVIGICKTVSELQEFTSKSSNRELKKKEVVLVDQSKTAISLTIWGTQAETFIPSEKTVVLVKSAKICEFRGAKSLSLVMGSQLKINPDVHEAHSLKVWYDVEGHQAEIKNVSASLTSVGGVPWMTFKEVQQRDLTKFDRGFYYQTFGTILLVRLDRAVYKSCPGPECQKKVLDLENGMYRCEKCNREYPNFKYRLLVSMNISDSTSSQWVTMFSSEAEKILGRTAQEIGEMMETDSDKVAKIFDDVQFKQFVFKCRAKLETYNDEQKVKTIVVNVSPVNFEEHHAYLLQRIEKFRGISATE